MWVQVRQRQPNMGIFSIVPLPCMLVYYPSYHSPLLSSLSDLTPVRVMSQFPDEWSAPPTKCCSVVGGHVAPITELEENPFVLHSNAAKNVIIGLLVRSEQF